MRPDTFSSTRDRMAGSTAWWWGTISPRSWRWTWSFTIKGRFIPRRTSPRSTSAGATKFVLPSSSSSWADAALNLRAAISHISLVILAFNFYLAGSLAKTSLHRQNATSRTDGRRALIKSALCPSHRQRHPCRRAQRLVPRRVHTTSPMIGRTEESTALAGITQCWLLKKLTSARIGSIADCSQSA